MTVWERGAVAFRPQGRRWERHWVGPPDGAGRASPATRRSSQVGTRPIGFPAASYWLSGRDPGAACARSVSERTPGGPLTEIRKYMLRPTQSRIMARRSKRIFSRRSASCALAARGVVPHNGEAGAEKFTHTFRLRSRVRHFRIKLLWFVLLD